jgi:hypothetical protein
MILSHSRYVPFDLRAERVELLPIQSTDVSTRRPIRRAVFCIDCGEHRTLILDAGAWTPGTKFVSCGFCLRKAVTS